MVTVVQSYYAIAAAQQKVDVSRRASQEGEHFLKITQDLERGGEAPHSDVVKAQIQSIAQDQALREAQLAMGNARLDLAVLISADFDQNFQVVDDLPRTASEKVQTRFLAAALENPIASRIHSRTAVTI